MSYEQPARRSGAPSSRRAQVLVGLAAALGLVAALAAPAWAQGPPMARDVQASTPAGMAVTVALHSTDDFDASLAFAIDQPPAHGSLGSIENTQCQYPGGQADCTAQVVYTPEQGFAGPDRFTYSASDQFTRSNSALASIAVVGTPRLPGPRAATVGVPYTGVAAALVSGATVDYGDGSGPRALTVGPDGTATLAHVYGTEGDYTVTVANHGPAGSPSATTLANVLLAGPLGAATASVFPGATGVLTVPGMLQLVATLTAAPTDPGPVTLVAGAYPVGAAGFTSGEPGTLGLGGFDLRALAAGLDDQLVVVFTYADLPFEGIPVLSWFDAATGAFRPVQGSTRVPPDSLTVDVLRRLITLRLDATSSPSIAGLRGTRFAVGARRATPPRTSLTISPHCLTPPRRGAASLRLGVRLSQPARATIRIQRRGDSPARRLCPHGPSRRPFVPGRFGRARSFVRNLPAGRRTLTLPVRRTGAQARAAVLLRLPVLKLAPGTYQVTLVARNTHGAVGEARRSFIVLRR